MCIKTHSYIPRFHNWPFQLSSWRQESLKCASDVNSHITDTFQALQVKDLPDYITAEPIITAETKDTIIQPV